MKEKNCVGFVVPPAAGNVPPDADAVYPDVLFLAEGLGLEEMTFNGYESVVDRVSSASQRLVDRGANVVSLMGTSLSFYKGQDFNHHLMEALQVGTVATTTMSTALITAVKTLGITRPAVCSAYEADVHSLLLEFLGEAQIESAGSAHMSIRSIDEVHKVDEDTVLQLAHEAMANSKSPDGIVISCGGLRTARAVIELEAAYGLPVVSSPLAGLWASVGMLDPTIPGAHESALFSHTFPGNVV